MLELVKQPLACLPAPVVGSTEFAHLGFQSDWWRKVVYAQSATTLRSYSEGTLGLEFMEVCQPETRAAKVTAVVDEVYFVDAAAFARTTVAPTTSAMVYLVPGSWTAHELEIGIGPIFLQAMEARSRELTVTDDEESSAESEMTVVTSFDEADEVRRTLDLTWEQLAVVTGISEQTFYDWKRNKRTARPSTLRKLRRVQALVRAVQRLRGSGGAAEWFQMGSPSPVEQMAARHL